MINDVTEKQIQCINKKSQRNKAYNNIFSKSLYSDITALILLNDYIYEK